MLYLDYDFTFLCVFDIKNIAFKNAATEKLRNGCHEPRLFAEKACGENFKRQ